MTRPSGSKRQSLAAALLCGSLASASVGCTNPSPKVPPPPKPQPTMAPLAVGDADFAKAVHRLLRERARTPQRSALLVGAVRRQLVHAGSRFDAGDETGGTSAVMGALYLLRVGDARKDLFDPSSRGALAGAMRKFSARGDVGRARALMVMQATLFRDGSTERKELDSHIKALEQWMADTRTGGTIVSLADEERAAVGRALVDPSEGPIDEAAKAIDKWIDRAIEYNTS